MAAVLQAALFVHASPATPFVTLLRLLLGLLLHSLFLMEHLAKGEGAAKFFPLPPLDFFPFIGVAGGLAVLLVWLQLDLLVLLLVEPSSFWGTSSPSVPQLYRKSSGDDDLPP